MIALLTFLLLIGWFITALYHDYKGDIHKTILSLTWATFFSVQYVFLQLSEAIEVLTNG